MPEFSQLPNTIAASPEHVFQLPLFALCLLILPTWKDPHPFACEPPTRPMVESISSRAIAA